MPTLIECMRYIFRNKELRPKSNWIIFKNGTFFVLSAERDETKEKLIVRGEKWLSSYGNFSVGSSSADFMVTRLDTSYPNDLVYAVQYEIIERGVLFGSMVILTEPKKDIQIGQEARALRQQDYEKPQVLGTSKD